MVAPKCSRFFESTWRIQKRFELPTWLLVHPNNDPQGQRIGPQPSLMPLLQEGHKAGVLESSFVLLKVKSDLMGRTDHSFVALLQKPVLFFVSIKMIEKGMDAAICFQGLFSTDGKQFYWKALKYGGIYPYDGSLVQPLQKLRAFWIVRRIKGILLRPLFPQAYGPISWAGSFLQGLWLAGLGQWYKKPIDLESRQLEDNWHIEKTPAGQIKFPEQEFYDHGVLMVAMVRAGVELAFEAIETGNREIIAESAVLWNHSWNPW